MTEEWVDIHQIARYLHASKEKIYKLAQYGRMPASKFGNQWRFKKSLVDQWLLKNQSKWRKRPSGKSRKSKTRSNEK